MAGIIPETTSGGVVVRTAGGVCQSPTGVSYAYCPDADFSSNCAFNYLPNDCTARITAAQINAFQSELLCFAETLNPDGNWNCSNTCNLSRLFDFWRTSNSETYTTSFFNTLQVHLCENTASLTDFNDIEAQHLICDGEGNVLTATEQQLAQNVVDWVCLDGGMAQELSTCLISGQDDNILEQGNDGKLFVPETAVDVESICADAVDMGTGAGFPNRSFMFCSGNENIGLMAVDDVYAGIVAAICADEPVGLKTDLIDCLISDQAENTLVTGNDDLLYAEPDVVTTITRLTDGRIRYRDEEGNSTTLACYSPITFGCEDQSFRITDDCTGDDRMFRPIFRKDQVRGTPFQFSVGPTTPDGVLAGSELTLTADVGGGCRQFIEITMGTGWMSRQNDPLEPGVDEQGFTARFQISIDGGATFTGMSNPAGGQNVNAQQTRLSESEYQRGELLGAVSGTVSIVGRISIEDNLLQTSVVSNTSFGYFVRWADILCCNP